jgi:hypothetical protein
MNRISGLIEIKVIVAISVFAMAAWGAAGLLMAQAPGVEIVRDRGEQFDMLVKKANELVEKKALLSLDDVHNQLERKTCKIQLPQPGTIALSDREVWERSRAAHVRVGWHYRCKHCDKWHQNLAGGYFINAEGAVATCYHVIEKEKDTWKDGYLIAANNRGDLFPVIEVLAADEVTDTAIIRVKVETAATPLPLNPNTYPGDSAWCYSNPLGRSGYFSKGMINRFYIYKKNKTESSRMEVSTDWAPGSSGAAVLDVCGNAIGHVSQISAAATGMHKDHEGEKGDAHDQSGKRSAKTAHPVMIFHCASLAADVLALVEGTQKPAGGQ